MLNSIEYVVVLVILRVGVPVIETLPCTGTPPVTLILESS